MRSGCPASPRARYRATPRLCLWEFFTWRRGLPPVPGAHATARLASFSAGTRVDLSVNGLTPAPDAVYELWCIRDDGTKMSAGTFRVDSSGRAIVHLTTAARLGDYHRLSVERTAPRGSRTRVMAGQVEY